MGSRTGEIDLPRELGEEQQGVLAKIVKKITLAFEEHKARLEQKLHIKELVDSHREEDTKLLQADVARGAYEQAEERAAAASMAPEPPRALVINHFGEGGIQLNIADMAKYIAALVEHTVSHAEPLKPMATPFVAMSQSQQVGHSMSLVA